MSFFTAHSETPNGKPQLDGVSLVERLSTGGIQRAGKHAIAFPWASSKRTEAPSYVEELDGLKQWFDRTRDR
jgi:hypothetical protein